MDDGGYPSGVFGSGGLKLARLICNGHKPERVVLVLYAFDMHFENDFRYIFAKWNEDGYLLFSSCS